MLEVKRAPVAVVFNLLSTKRALMQIVYLLDIFEFGGYEQQGGYVQYSVGLLGKPCKYLVTY